MGQNHLKILDTTLRDGEQSLSNGLHPSDKHLVASILSDIGVDAIEAGFPTSSTSEYSAIRHISSLGLQSTISVMTRALKQDIDYSYSSISQAPKRMINILFPVSDDHLTKKLRLSKQEALNYLDSIFIHASTLPCEIQFTAEDATRADPEFLINCVQHAAKHGATTITLPDTVGISVPQSYADLFSNVISQAALPEDVTFSAHCHNDLGLATANTLSAVLAGARQVELTMCGVGERSGNAPLEQVIASLSLNQSHFHVTHGISTTDIYDSAHKISSLLNYKIHDHAPIIGSAVYSSRAGIHQQGMLKSLSLYQGFDQSLFGAPSSTIVIGKHSGKASLISVLNQFGIHPDSDLINLLIPLVKDASALTQSGNISNDQVLELYQSLL